MVSKVVLTSAQECTISTSADTSEYRFLGDTQEISIDQIREEVVCFVHRRTPLGVRFEAVTAKQIAGLHQRKSPYGQLFWAGLHKLSLLWSR